MRGGGTDTIWHETVQGGEYRLATGTTDAQEELAISTSTGLRLRGNVTSQLGGFYSGNGKSFPSCLPVLLTGMPPCASGVM